MLYITVIDHQVEGHTYHYILVILYLPLDHVWWHISIGLCERQLVYTTVYSDPSNYSRCRLHSSNSFGIHCHWLRLELLLVVSNSICQERSGPLFRLHFTRLWIHQHQRQLSLPKACGSVRTSAHWLGVCKPYADWAWTTEEAECTQGSPHSACFSWDPNHKVESSFYSINMFEFASVCWRFLTIHRRRGKEISDSLPL